MSQTTHTPGPWRAECEKWPLVRDGNKWWRVYAGESDMVAEVGRHADANPGEIAEDAANARLIAAAPDLLAALQGCIAFRNWQLCEGGVTPAELIDTFKRSEAAIRKATWDTTCDT